MSASQSNRSRLLALVLAVALLLPAGMPAGAKTAVPLALRTGEEVILPPAPQEDEPPGGESAPPADSEQPPGGDDMATLESTVPLATTVDDTALTPQATPADMPKITLEARVTTDAFDVPDGGIELIVRVETAPGKDMMALSLSLQHAAELEPTNWPGGVITMGSVDFATYIPAKHSSDMTTAEAYGGGTNGSFYFYIESTALPQLATPGGVAVAALRFHAKEPLILKNGAIHKVTNTGYDPTDPTTATATVEIKNIFKFNADPVAALTPNSRCALYYASGENEFYHVPGYDGTAATEDTVTHKVNGADTPFQKPKTAGAAILAVRPDLNPATPPASTYYSYLTNHIPKANVLWTQTQGESFDSGGGMSLDDVATVVFFDWDDSFLGATAVGKGVDNRKKINDFVLSTMVHPDLQTNKNYSSLDRKDTYRGEYPCIDPGTGATFPDTHAQPGKSYPLTNKLDYTFYKKVVTVTNGTAAVTAPSDATYPYIHGWQLVTPTTMSDTWTALGTGEAVASADFKKITDDVVYVKALYEPGTLLDFAGPNSTGNTSRFYSFGGFVYEFLDINNVIINCELSRKNADGYGTTRLKSSGFKFKYTLDSVEMWMSLEIGEGEKATATIVAPALARKLAMTVIDFKEAGISNYTAATAVSGEKVINSHNKVGDASNQGFVGAVIAGVFNEHSTQQVSALAVGSNYSKWALSIAANQFTMLNVPDEMLNISNQYPAATTDAQRRNIAKNRILIYQAARNNAEMSYQEIVSAIKLDTQDYLTTTTSTAYLRYFIETLMTAYTRNGSRNLSDAQVIKILQKISGKYGSGKNPTAPLTAAEIDSCL